MSEPFRDPDLPVTDRVEDLLTRLTLREKIGQLNQRVLGWRSWTRGPAGFVTTRDLDTEIKRWDGIGAIYGLLRADAWSGQDWTTGADPAASAEIAAMVQERVVAGSRFGIPALFVEEGSHGHQALGGQLFPTSIGMAATWQPELAEEAAAHIGRELRARGVHAALVSGLDMLRDPRWGRSEETFGEDPMLSALFVRAMVRGMQSVPGVAVVLKHYVAQGAGIGGRNSSGAPIGPRELAEIHLTAARAGVDAGALGLMAAYNDIDGIPCSANEYLLTRVLRDEWGFRGVVMADMLAVDRMIRAADGPALAGAVALRAGIDMSMCDTAFVALEEAVGAGLVAEPFVDRACRRVLELKIRLGLLDRPGPLPAFPPPPVPASAPVPALTAAGTVLLQNRGDLLPLATTPARVAVIGPTADDVQALLGDYVPPLPAGHDAVSVLAGVRAVTGAQVRYEQGCTLLDPIDGGRDRAAAAAADADLVVLVLGSTSERGYDDDFQTNGAGALGGVRPVSTCGEGFDVAEVDLPAAQRDLVDAVAASGTPVVAVVVSGRPHGLGRVVAACDAVLYAWYPGPTGGRHLAELIFGDHEPVGRLPVSLPRSSGVLPVAYNERLENTRRYVDSEGGALFPFGAGLGYTTWAVDGVSVSTERTTVGELAGVAGVAVAGTVVNTGTRRGTQVVQLYARALIPGVQPRRAVLVGFTRVTLDPGMRRTVRIGVEPDAVAGLGLSADTSGSVRLWLSVSGAGEPVDSRRVDLTPPPP